MLNWDGHYSPTYMQITLRYLHRIRIPFYAPHRKIGGNSFYVISYNHNSKKNFCLFKFKTIKHRAI